MTDNQGNAVTTIDNVYYDADNEIHTTSKSQTKSKSIDVVNQTKNVYYEP